MTQLLSKDGLTNDAFIKGYESSPSPQGLTCLECDNFACRSCIEDVLLKAQSKCSSLAKSDRWCIEVKERIEKGSLDGNILGHCCEWKIIHNTQQSQEVLQATDSLRYDGHIYFPEYGLLIDFPFGSIDIHGLGEAPNIDAVWHCVLSIDTAREAAKHKLNIPSINAIPWNDLIVSVLLPTKKTNCRVSSDSPLLFDIFPKCSPFCSYFISD